MSRRHAAAVRPLIKVCPRLKGRPSSCVVTSRASRDLGSGARGLLEDSDLLRLGAGRTLGNRTQVVSVCGEPCCSKPCLPRANDRLCAIRRTELCCCRFCGPAKKREGTHPNVQHAFYSGGGWRKMPASE